MIKKPNRLLIFSLSIIIILILILVNPFKSPNSQESITYFPIDKTTSFQSANTSLTLLNTNQINSYKLKWKIGSNLAKNVYLRQDISLLFSNGKLLAKMGKWKQNVQTIEQEKTITGRDSSYLSAISFHFSEIHYPNNQLTSAQALSADSLYVIKSAYSPLHTFRVPQSKEDKEWAQLLNRETERTLEKSWTRAINYFNINRKLYEPIPFVNLPKYTNEPFPGFSQTKTTEIMGMLWEGIYKNYFLGIKLGNGKVIDPINSTVPLLLIAKDKTHLLVLTEAKNGEPIVLRQNITHSR